MGATVVFENEAIIVWCDPSRRLVHHEMRKPCPGREFIEALSAGLVAMRSHRCDRWLSDDRRHIALAPETERWGRETWAPAAREAGWRFWAIVQPTSAVGHLSSVRLHAFPPEFGVTAFMFSDIGEANAWLDAQR